MARSRQRRSRRRTLALLTGLVATFVLVIGVPNSGAVHDFDPPTGIGDLFELDDNALDDSTPAGDDWDTVVGGTGSDTEHVFATDFSNEDDDTFCQGTKEIHDLSAWNWCDNTASNDKNDIEHAYAAVYTVPSDGDFENTPLAGHQILYLGADRFANNGDSGLGFMFLQSGLEKLGCSPTPCVTIGGTFGNGLGGPAAHVDGDVYVVSQFTQGGEEVTADVYRWDGIAPGIGWVLEDTGVDCDVATANDNVCATVFGDGDNATNLATDAPWTYTTKFPGEDPPGTPQPNDFAEGTFFEGGVDLTHFDLEGCFQTVLADTSQSQNIVESMQDFVFDDFELCSVEIRKDGPGLSKVGDDVTYDFEIENTGAAKLFLDTLTDDVLGDLEEDAPDACDVLDVGEICSFSVNYTVQEGDPDPLVNTVTAVYKGEEDLSGAAISDTDDHSVELFQPAVEVVKDGTELSKVGDTVTYNFKIFNRSSTDSPNLVVESIDDTLLLDLLDDAPAACDELTDADGDDTGGTDQCSFSVNRVVQAGDPDPLNNTVTVVYNPSGFTNDISDTDSHSVNLFQPSVAVTKLCAPASVTVGQTVTFTCSILNTSSADAPNLILDSVTDVRNPGNVVTDLTATAIANGCDPLAPAASCSFTYTATATTVGTLTNTVTAHYHPSGFSNDITDDGTCSVEVTGGEGCTPGFFKRFTNVWDEFGDPIVVNVRAAITSLGSPFTYAGTTGLTAQLFRNIFGLTSAQMTAAGLDPTLTMLQAINLGGGGFEKLARHGVAGLLSSASVAYPFDTEEVLQMVQNAIVTLQAEPTATQLADANNLSHQNCPKT